MNRSTPGLPVYHQLPESTQTHVHWVSDAIHPSHPLPSPSPPAFSLSQHQGLFKWVSSSHQVAKVLEFQLQNPGTKRGQKCPTLYFPLSCSRLHSKTKKSKYQYTAVCLTNWRHYECSILYKMVASKTNEFLCPSQLAPLNTDHSYSCQIGARYKARLFSMHWIK